MWISKVFAKIICWAQTDTAHVYAAVRNAWAKLAKGHRVVFFSAVPDNETVFDMLRRYMPAHAICFDVCSVDIVCL